jgi:hypothetical protein
MEYPKLEKLVLKDGVERVETLDTSVLDPDVEGWFDFQDVYAEIADELPTKGVFVEIGSWMGKSTIFMAKCLQFFNKGTVFYCVDTWEGSVSASLGSVESDFYVKRLEEIKKLGKTPFNLFMENLVKYKVSTQVFPIVKSSVEAARFFSDGSVSGVFIDAGHSYESVLADLYVWYPKLTRPGYFAGHDYYWGEVNLALRKFSSYVGLAVKPIGNSWKIIY